MFFKLPSISLPKANPFTIETCEKITKFCMYALVVAMPILFLPGVSDALKVPKLALLIFLVFIALFFWIVKALLWGSFTVNLNKINLAILAFWLALLISTIFSVNQNQSFWGSSQATNEGFISLTCLFLVFFLVSSTFSGKNIFFALHLLGISALIAQAYAALQIFSIHLIPFGFAANDLFNTVGATGAVGFFAVSLLPLFIVMVTLSLRWWRVVFAANIVTTLLLLTVINYRFLWITVIVGSVVIIFFWTLKRESLDARWMFLPVFFLVIAGFFLIFSPQLRWLPKSPLELSISQKASLAISAKSLRADPLFGSGPATHSYDFALYRSAEFNDNSFWNLNFGQGASKVLTAMATLGVAGLASMMCLMGLVLYFGGRYLLWGNVSRDKVRGSLILGLVAFLTVQTVGAFFYNFNLVLEFLYFFGLACMAALLFSPRQTYSLKYFSKVSLVAMVACILIIILGFSVVVLESQRYLADLSYTRSVVAFRKNNKQDAIKYVKRAIARNRGYSAYFNQLSIYSLALLQEKINTVSTGNASDEDRKLAQTLVSDTINAANISTNMNPKSVDAWSTRGYVCQNLLVLLADGLDCAITSYDKAIALSPTDPSLLFQQGNTYVAQASLPGKSRDDLLAKANEKFMAAVNLKKNYGEAYLQMALIAKLRGDTKTENGYLQQAITNSSGNAKLALRIGLVYYQEQRFSEALVQFQRSLSIDSNYADGLYYAGLAYDKLGQKENAINAFNKVLELNPNNDIIKKILDNLNAGRPALSGLQNQPPPVETQTPEAPSPGL